MRSSVGTCKGGNVPNGSASRQIKLRAMKNSFVMLDRRMALVKICNLFLNFSHYACSGGRARFTWLVCDRIGWSELEAGAMCISLLICGLHRS